MRHRKLGRNGLNLRSDGDAIALIHHALKLGIVQIGAGYDPTSLGLTNR